MWHKISDGVQRSLTTELNEYTVAALHKAAATNQTALQAFIWLH